MKGGMKSWPEFHQRINLIYHAIIAISLVPFALIFLEIDSGNTTSPQVNESNQWILIPVLVVAIAILCYLVWKNMKVKLASISKNDSIKARLITYFKLQTRRYLLLELAAMISLGGLWLTINYIFVVAYLLVLVQFSLLRPSQDKVIRDMEFTKEEREHLRKEEL